MSEILQAKRGDSLRLEFSFTENGAPADLSLCTARFQIRKKRSGTLLLDCSSNDYLTINGPSGKVFANIPASLMKLDTGKHEADVELTYADGTVVSSSTFTVDLVIDITRDES
jgi:hypothetical protein